MYATIITYRSNRDVDIQFEDGTIVTHKEYRSFRKGITRNPSIVKTKHTGEQRHNNVGKLMTIVKWKSARDIDVAFESGYIATNRTYADFTRGKIKDRDYYVGKSKLMNNGMRATITAYRSCDDIDVEFDNGVVINNTDCEKFKKGTIKISCVGERNLMNCGMEAEIITYRNASDIDIKFDDGTIREHVSYYGFNKGQIMNNNYNPRIGETKLMKNGLMAEIIEYRSCDDIDVRFEDGYIAEHKTYYNFKNGTARNPYAPSIYDIGYLGDAKSVDEYGNTKRSYSVWRGMIDRCYNSNSKQYHCYGGRGVTVCEEWHNYSNFEKWYDTNFYTLESGERVEIDKDILVDDNKIYSPTTCIFAPKQINTMFIDGGSSKKKKNDLPIGVYYDKEKKKYRSEIDIKGKAKKLGTFNTPEEAEAVYLKAKSEYIKQMAEEYKEVIPEQLYKRLLELASFCCI